MAFKPETDDIREAPALVLINQLLEAGAHVQAYDPEATENVRARVGDQVTFCDDKFQTVQDADALVIMTEWDIRDWLYVEDHCHAIQTVLETGRVGQTYNVGGNSERTNREIVDTICRLVDELRPDLPHRPCSSLVKFVNDRPGHDRRYAIDASKIGDGNTKGQI